METGLTADGVDRIDWSAPWLADLREVAAPLWQYADWRTGLNALADAQALCNYRELPIRFVQQEELPAGMAYEEFIGATGQVPTRANLHDFFNALVWLAYPQVKRQLNALQAADIMLSAGRPKAPSARGKLRDGATIFDENAALFVSADAPVIEALRGHRWSELFMARRAAFDCACSVLLFGHALMEKLTAPYKAITAHAWVVEVEANFFLASAGERRAQLDHLLARQLERGLSTADFSPLPVLGVPGWHARQDETFYADPFVFRPKRAAR